MTFEFFAQQNRARCESMAQDLDHWKPWEWTNAAAGEVGEMCVEMLALVTAVAAHMGSACNIGKKMSRMWPGNMFKQAWNKPEDQRMDELRQRMMREIGDVTIYNDLLAQRLGTTLEECVRLAFNEKSEEIGSVLKV